MAQDDLLTYVQVLNRWKRFIVVAVAATAIVAVIVSFFLPKWYKARSTLIPPQTSELSAGLSALVQGIALPGLGNVTPTSGDVQLFLAILNSQTIQEQVIRKFDLMAVYKARTMDDALKRFRALAGASLTDLGVIEVVVEDRSPQRAADIANAWVQFLDDFNKNARMTAGKRTRIFVEGRLNETQVRLRAAEDSLAAYQRSHKSAPLTAGSTAAVESGASLLARRLSLQVELAWLGDLYKESAPQVEQARAELAALDRQIDALPPLGMEYARRLRDMKVQEQVFALLTSQYEEARIRENKDVPTLEVLDLAEPPQRRSRPIRWLFCGSLTAAAALLSLGTAFGVEFARRLRARVTANG